MSFIIVSIIEKCMQVIQYGFRQWEQTEVVLKERTDASDGNTCLESLDTVLPMKRSNLSFLATNSK